MRSGFDAWREIRVFSRAVPHLLKETRRALSDGLIKVEIC